VLIKWANLTTFPGSWRSPGEAPREEPPPLYVPPLSPSLAALSFASSLLFCLLVVSSLSLARSLAGLLALSSSGPISLSRALSLSLCVLLSRPVSFLLARGLFHLLSLILSLLTSFFCFVFFQCL